MGKPLIASQIIRDELSFEVIQEVDVKHIDRASSVFRDVIHTPERARWTVIGCLENGEGEFPLVLASSVKTAARQPISTRRAA